MNLAQSRHSRQLPTCKKACRELFQPMFIGLSRQSRHLKKEKERTVIFSTTPGSFRFVSYHSKILSGLSGLSGLSRKCRVISILQVPTLHPDGSECRELSGLAQATKETALFGG